MEDLESSFFEEGYKRGLTRGEAMGRENGLKHGKMEGHEIGFEMGFLLGAAEACKILQAENADTSRAADSVISAVEKVDLNKLPNQGKLQVARARYKVLEARTGLNLAKAAHSGDDFSF